MRKYPQQRAFSTLFRLAFVISLAGCVRYAPVPRGVLTHESETRYANDSLKVSLYDFARMRFTMGSLTSADKQLLRRLPHRERVVRVLFTSHNDVRSLPSHRLLGLVRMALPVQWQRDYQPRGQVGQRPYYYRMMPGARTDVFDCLVPNTSPVLELVLEVPHHDIGGLATTQAYFLEEMDYVVQGLHTGTAYQPTPPTNPFELLGEAFGPDSTTGNYLAPVTQLHAAAENYVGLNEQGAFCQALATAYACVDEPDSAAYYWRKMGGPLPSKATGQARPFDLLPATAEVLRQTAATSLVLFNENHVQPKGRYWLRTLLPALYQQGFRYLALEALGDDANLPQRGYPTLGSGFYLREPQLANLVREALALGFTLVPYDTMADDREQGQAQNLWRRSLGQDPQAKVVVLAGFGHIDERVGSGKSMARWLHELSGINPLTINQTDLETLAPATGEEGVFLAREHDAAPPIRHYMTNDIYVINNLNIKDKGNGNGVGTTQPVAISVPADSLVRDQSFALLVYARAEYRAVPNPVPVWVHIGKASRQRAFLRPGQYVTVAKNSGGTILWRAELAVP
jgi:hypothetical protein